MIRVTAAQLKQLNEKGFSRIGFSVWDVFDEGIHKFDNTYYCMEISFMQRTCYRIPVSIDRRWGKHVVQIKCGGWSILVENTSEQDRDKEDDVRVFVYKKSIADEFIRLFNKKAVYNVPNQKVILPQLCYDCLLEILKTYKRKD